MRKLVAAAIAVAFLIPLGAVNAHVQGECRHDRGYPDQFHCTNGSDWQHGTGGGDIFWGYNGADNLTGHEGADRMIGGDGDDRLQGGNGDDNFQEQYSQGDADRVCDGPGNDIIRLDDGDGQDVWYRDNDGNTEEDIEYDGGTGGDSIINVTVCPF